MQPNLRDPDWWGSASTPPPVYARAGRRERLSVHFGPGARQSQLGLGTPQTPPLSSVLSPVPSLWRMHTKTPSMQSLLASDSSPSPEGSLDQFDLLEEGKQHPRPARRPASAVNNLLANIHARLPTHLPQISTRKVAAVVAVAFLLLLGWSAHGRSAESRGWVEGEARRRSLSRARLGGPQGTVEVLKQRVIPKEELLTKAAPARSLYDALKPELRYLICDSWSGLSKWAGCRDVRGLNLVANQPSQSQLDTFSQPLV